MKAFGRRFVMVVVFTLVGAPLGGVAMVGVGWIALLVTDPGEAFGKALTAILLTPIAAIGGFALGFLPALLTGTSAAVSGLWVKGRIWMALASVMGAVFSALSVGGYDHLLVVEDGGEIMIGVAGAVAALACSLMTRSLNR